ncbi:MULTISPECIES: phosphoadenosine phosphosulfate reductase family protein [unclassified Serratia (in: enterobacteria)]|uniref:phosphoadenosine phosphosulfate reductase domain-containing protein n=1 Tax=unclassified Serratia (in: enterobacteria) TaxID=2647522 RepID=UPI00068BE05E|nr:MULTISPECIES: phosphoadenosine phosphosulfate reductase family protein [unclassified Serratia (in: enterobacteria)]
MKVICYPAGTAFIDSRVLDQDAISVLSVSGGKDSLAQWLLARDAGVEVLPVFADTGNEHPVTMEYLDYLESKLGAIRRVKADFTKRIEGKRKFIAERWPITLVSECGYTDEQAADIIKMALDTLKPTGVPFLDLCMWKGRFPSTKVRFCTFELKHIPIRDQVVSPLLEEYDEVISWQGVRAEESRERAALSMWVTDADETPGLNVYRPILDWKHADVFALAKSHGIKPNPLYLQGCGRVGCMPCINVNKAELSEIFLRWPEEIERIARWERIVAACSRRQNSTFFPSTQDPKKSERRIECITVDSHGINTYRDWALTTRGGRQFDLIAGMHDKAVCSSVYAGVCE